MEGEGETKKWTKKTFLSSIKHLIEEEGRCRKDNGKQVRYVCLKI